MGKTKQPERARIKGVESEEKSKVDEIMEGVDVPEYNIVDKALSEELTGKVGQHFKPSLVYNKPVTTNSGKQTWKECDLYERDSGRPCPYKGKKSHKHILGLGIQGSLVAMDSYGMMEADVSDHPKLIEEAGRFVYVCYAYCRDGHTGNYYGRWYREPLMMKSGNKFIENDHAFGWVQSKALRNVINALLPAGLVDLWLANYKNGKEGLTAADLKKAGYEPPKQSQKRQSQGRSQSQSQRAEPEEKDKQRSQSPGEVDLAAIAGSLAEKMKVDQIQLLNFSAKFFSTTAKATLSFNRALQNTEEGKSIFETIKEEFAKWQTDGGAKQEEMEM